MGKGEMYYYLDDVLLHLWALSILQIWLSGFGAQTWTQPCYGIYFRQLKIMNKMVLDLNV